ncbi:MAG: phytanoyl-CoA dioxygenase family protein [Candidatus Latescibacterota bacterium]|jgi:phytanoyl-CoA hydroxylase
MLDSQDVVRFREEGYLVFERLIHGPKLDYYLAAFDELVEKSRSLSESEPHFSLELDAEEKPIAGMLHKVQSVCLIEPRILELAKERAILDRIETLLGPNIDLFGSTFFPKLADGGTSTHWHQDNYYFGTDSDQIISCGIYLQDTDAENGCLQVVPGSHRSGRLADHERDPSTHGSWTHVDEQQAVMLPMPAGTVVLFSSNLLHGTADNTSTCTRYSTTWHYIPGDLDLANFPRGGYDDRYIVRGQ